MWEKGACLVAFYQALHFEKQELMVNAIKFDGVMLVCQVALGKIRAVGLCWVSTSSIHLSLSYVVEAQKS